MLEYLEISWINAGSAWKTQKGCVALQLCSSGVLNLQGIPGSTCWSTTGVFVFNAGSHHTKGFDTSQQHHWRERQVASSVENSKSCPNKYHIYNSTCPKLKLDFWGFQMFPAFLSCLKLSQVVSGLCLGTQRSEVRGHIQGPELLQLIGASPAQPQPQPYAGGKVTCVELCRVSSGCFRCFVCSICVTVWSISFNFIILVNLELKLLNPSQTILWLVGSLARWCVSLSLPRDWRVLTKGLFLASTLMSHVIHWSDSFWFSEFAPLFSFTWFHVSSGVLVHAFICFLTWHQRFCGTGRCHGQILSTFRIRMSRAEFQAVGSLFSSKQCEKYLDPPSVLFASMNLVDRITSGVILVLVSIRRARSQAANQERGPRQPSGPVAAVCEWKV